MIDDAPDRDRDPDERDASDGVETETGVLRPTRRRVLRTAAAAGTVVAAGGITFGQDEEPLDPAETIVLGGRVEGWQGRDPQRIDGQVNPTLNLQVGETYDLTWINVDGLPHNFVILDQEGSRLRSTEIMDQQGGEQSVSFKATEQMATYLCEVHPTSMRGSIQTGAPATETPQPQQALVPQGPRIGLQKVAGDPVTQPVGFEATTVQGSEQRFIVDQTGEIYMITEGGVREFLDITPRIVIDDEGFDERGLLGLAFHPNFQQNRTFYVRYSGRPRLEELPRDYDHVFVLSEFRANQEFTQADPASERRLLEIPEPQFNHNAGDLAFGPDGLLYVTVGDGGGADDTGVGHVNDWYNVNRGGNGQDVTENLLGSILRIDVDAREPGKRYGVPDENPLVGTEGLDEIWAWGFRNPWRMSFNRGQLIVADVGQNLWEEIDLVREGGNYGWNVREGFHCFSTENPNSPQAITECPTHAPDDPPYNGQRLVNPLLEYPHTVEGQTIGLSVTGGYVYFNDTIQRLQGRYVFGDWSASFEQPAGRLWTADLQRGGGFEPEVAATETPSGNQTAGNQTAGNQTAGNGTPGQAEQPQFPMQELQVAQAPEGRLNRTVLAFGRDTQGELYVLTSTTTTVDGTGEVFKIVPPGQGEPVQPPQG